MIAYLRNDNDPKLAMSGMLIGSLSNIILDYVFMYPLNWGIFGAAFATGLAPIISLCILSIHFLKKQFFKVCFKRFENLLFKNHIYLRLLFFYK